MVGSLLSIHCHQQQRIIHCVTDLGAEIPEPDLRVSSVHVDDTQPGRQDYAVLLLRSRGTELPPVWAFVHVGVGAASVSIPGSRMAIADGQ